MTIFSECTEHAALLSVSLSQHLEKQWDTFKALIGDSSSFVFLSSYIVNSVCRSHVLVQLRRGWLRMELQRCRLLMVVYMWPAVDDDL